jgi:hypothetical protein
MSLALIDNIGHIKTNAHLFALHTDLVYLLGWTKVQLMVFNRQEVSDGDSNFHIVKINKSGGCAYNKLLVTLTWIEAGLLPGCNKCM